MPVPARTPGPSLVADQSIVAPGLRMDTIHRFADHERGRVGCQFDPTRRGLVCVTDLRSSDWHRKGVRLVRVDPATFAIEERVVAQHFHGSFLWGDFNRDGAPDFWGFSDELDDADARAVLYLATSDPWTFRETRPIVIDHPVLGGAVLDADGDGCEDVLLLGTGWEFQSNRAVQYFPDELHRGDCRGGFHLANRELGLDRLPDFTGNPAPARLGRTATVTDLDGDGRSDLVVGNYRAQPDSFLRSDRAGHFVRWAGDPDRDPRRQYFGHAVGLFPADLAARGRLDLVVFNLWHGDDRGAVTDRSYALRVDERGESTRIELPQPLEAPFGGAVADFDGDGLPDVLLATAHRGPPYEGHALLVRNGRVAWRDEADWLKLRETPTIVDLDLDGAPDLIGDGRVLAQRPEAGRRWIGFAFVGRSLSGSTGVLEDETGGRRAFAMASDGRGQPGNLLTLGLGAHARPRRLVLRDGASGREHIVDLRGLACGRYFQVTVE
ncbi:MAG: FG-GAP repeat protein [Deltaproteobacteria bacterium]|nr:FG-GAP repeat protein [Myxococcales bacterium]MDP3219591.1 FG-GAP repeat protein [Deltaproteobacteria bacterium]